MKTSSKSKPVPGSRCMSTCWRGEPGHKMADAARCKLVTGHSGPWHEDKNGNRFVGSGLQSKVVVVRSKQPQ